MTPIDELESAARAATPGRWEREDSPYAVEWEREDSPYSVVVRHESWDQVIATTPRQCNRDYIAAANPQTVLALVRIARAAVENERVRSTVFADRVRNAADYLSNINAILQSRADLIAAIADTGLLP